MLLETINNSISDKSKHLTPLALASLFNKDEFTPVEMYALDVMFTEAPLQEILDCLKENRIPVSKAVRLYADFKKSRKQTPHDKYEWLFG